MASAVELVQIDLSPRMPRSKPEWLKARAPVGDNYHALKKLARGLELHTVCESAQCPNIGECWHHKTATFMLLGNLCTRRCGFCAVPKGKPMPIDYDEPRRVAEHRSRARVLRVPEGPRRQRTSTLRGHGRRRQAPAVEPSSPETDHFLFPVNHFEGQVRADLHDDHMNRIGADIDGGDTHEGGRRNGPAGGVLACDTCVIYWPVEPAAILP